MSKMLNSKPIKMWIDGQIFNIPRFSRNLKKLKKKETVPRVSGVNFEEDSQANEKSELLEIKLQEISSEKSKHIEKVQELLKISLQKKVQENVGNKTLEIDIDIAFEQSKQNEEVLKVEVQKIHLIQSVQKEISSEPWEENLQNNSLKESEQSKTAKVKLEESRQTASETYVPELQKVNLVESEQNDVISEISEVELQKGNLKQLKQSKITNMERDDNIEECKQEKANSMFKMGLQEFKQKESEDELQKDNLKESKQMEIADKTFDIQQQKSNLKGTEDTGSISLLPEIKLGSEKSNKKEPSDISEEKPQQNLVEESTISGMELQEVTSEEYSELEQAVYSGYLKLLDIKEDNGKFTTNFRLPKLYYSKLQNIPNFSIKKLSKDTNSKIFIPKLGQEGDIIVHSQDRENLIKAVSEIHLNVGEIREKNIPLQFVCIPCLNENVRQRFENLKNEILSLENEIDGLHESIFMCPRKLHITIDVYALLNDQEKEEAIKALNDYKTPLERILETTGPFKLNITGLDSMTNNIKKVDVLFANIKLVNETNEHNLQKIVNGISEHFYNRGLAKKYQDSVKLHMTIINTKYRKNTESPKRKRRRQSIDATKILEKFKDYSFGYCDFDSLHLSHMSLKREDGFYKPLSVINLDSNKNIK